MNGLDSLDKLAVTVVAEDSVLYESPYWGQHGISLMVEAEKNGFSRNYLIDVAQNPQALLHNMDLLSIDPARIDGSSSLTAITTIPWVLRRS
jgi:7,8-dihydropterin-6-yl-methyl-4-(beta-D-ribofuranosyl)aminobenzene 5'-phosphate synthase